MLPIFIHIIGTALLYATCIDDCVRKANVYGIYGMRALIYFLCVSLNLFYINFLLYFFSCQNIFSLVCFVTHKFYPGREKKTICCVFFFLCDGDRLIGK